jgi:hypothetical protein
MTMNIQWLNPNDITPYDKNPRNNDGAVQRVAESIAEFGFNQPIVVDQNKIIVVGHTRWKAAKKLGLDSVPVLTMPEHLSETKIRAYRIADNKLNELADWDDQLLIEELQAIANDIGSVDITGFDDKVFEDLKIKNDQQYTKKIDTPIYTPKGECPKISDLYNKDRTDQLLDEIKNSSAPEEVKKFLRLAAYRHTQFNYDQIAEYYCHADLDTQKLMEDSALVIIDFNKAIELGYCKLSDEIADVFLETDNGL